MPSYDGSSPAEGKSKEIDAIARNAAMSFQHNKDAVTNSEDPTNTKNTVCGNPDDPEYSKMRKIGPASASGM